MNRIKLSVSVDPGLIKVVDDFVRQHQGTDRSKVLDQALRLWSAAQQDEAMIDQYAGAEDTEAERTAWRATRRKAAGRRLQRQA